MSVPKHLLNETARRFRILGEPVRLELLNYLMGRDEATVQELIDRTGHKQSNVSKHLGVLAGAGLVARRKEGQKVYYRIDDPNLSAVCLLVCGSL